MNREKVLMVILFGTLALLNKFNYLDISEKAVFGLTLGALIISISTCFDFPESTFKDEKGSNFIAYLKNKKYKIIQVSLYSIGFLIMFIIIFVKPNKMLNELMKQFDSNTLTLLAIAITFLSITISNVNTKTQRNSIRKYYLDLYENRIEKIDNEQDNQKGRI